MTPKPIVGAFGLALIAGLVACAPEPPTAGQPAADDVGAQGTVLADLIKDWNDQKAQMMQIADAMPEETFGFRSTPPQRSYGEQIMHAALINLDLLTLLGGTAAAPTFTAESVTTKAEILQALADSYDYGTALLQEQTEVTIRQNIQDAPSWLGPSTRARIFWTLLAHSMDVYGQMAVYLRLNGIVPPASRGV
jgi:hypothetical protein